MGEPEAKKCKTAEDTFSSVNEKLTSFDNFNLSSILSDGSLSKSVSLLCQVNGKFDNKDAVVILEKTQFKEEIIPKILTEETLLTQNFHNDIYGTYSCEINPSFNTIKATVIHPATAKHIDKYRSHVNHLIVESYDDYLKYTKPYIESTDQLSLQWVDNILKHKSEEERIVFEDSDKEIGFVLLPDMKWNCERVEDLYLVAIIQDSSINSIRQLTTDNLKLLKNIKSKGLLAIKDKYGVAEHEVRVFIHYQPSYYHFHVHFTHVDNGGSDNLTGGIQCTRAHLLDTIINNIELVPDYYQKANLTFQLIKNSPLWKIFEKAGKFSDNKKISTA